MILRNCNNQGVFDVILWNQVERMGTNIDDLGKKFDYDEKMGLKECLGYFEAHLLPSKIDRIIILKFPIQDELQCKAFFKVIMRLAGDRRRNAVGASPVLTDVELEAVTAILSGEDSDPNAIESLKSYGVTSEIIEDIIEANPEKAVEMALNLAEKIGLEHFPDAKEDSKEKEELQE